MLSLVLVSVGAPEAVGVGGGILAVAYGVRRVLRPMAEAFAAHVRVLTKIEGHLSSLTKNHEATERASAANARALQRVESQLVTIHHNQGVISQLLIANGALPLSPDIELPEGSAHASPPQPRAAGANRQEEARHQEEGRP